MSDNNVREVTGEEIIWHMYSMTVDNNICFILLPGISSFTPNMVIYNWLEIGTPVRGVKWFRLTCYLALELLPLQIALCPPLTHMLPLYCISPYV